MIKTLLLEKNLMLYGYVVLTGQPRYEHYDVYKAVKIGSTALKQLQEYYSALF